MPDATTSPQTDNPLPQNGLALTPLTVGKPVPAKRIANASSAQSTVATLVQASLQRNLRNAAIQGMFDGNPPKNAAKLRAAGRASEANFNTLEAASLLATACVPYYDLFSGDRRYVDIRTRLGSPEQKTRWSGAMSEAYDRLLQSWDCFDEQMQTIITDFVAFGRGYAVFDDTKSWRFHKIAHNRVLVPDGSPIDLDRNELIVVLHDWQVSELYRKIKNEDTAREAGWHIEETRLAIAGAVPADPTTPNDALAVQQAMRDNDLYVSARSSTVQTSTLYVREFDGKWSEYMVRRNQLPSNATNEQASPRFMFKAHDKYENIREIINPFFYNVKDGAWNGASGLGRDIYVLMQLKDRIACTQADAVMLRNSIVLQPQTALDKSRMNLMQVGAVTWIPEGAQVQQSTILGDIASTIEVSRELTMQVERNTGVYRPVMEKGSGNPQTLGEFQMKFAQATVLSVASVNRFYSYMDRLYQQQCKRVFAKSRPRKDEGAWAESVHRFFDEIEAAGVPKEAYDEENLESVRAWRVIGNGSSSMRQQTLQQFMSLYTLLPANGQQALLQDVISVSGSPSQLDRYMPEADMQKLPTDQQEIALLENGVMKIGAPVTWTPSQNNIIHAQTHLMAASQAAASLEQGADPADVLAYLDIIGQHTAIHIQRESQVPSSKPAVAELAEQWTAMAQTADKLRGMLEKQAGQKQQLQQRQQDILTDQQLDVMEIQGKNEISRFKAAKTLDLKGERQQVDLGLKAQKQAAEGALKDASTAADITIKRFTAQADAAIAAEKARADSAIKARNGTPTKK